MVETRKSTIEDGRRLRSGITSPRGTSNKVGSSSTSCLDSSIPAQKSHKVVKGTKVETPSESQAKLDELYASLTSLSVLKEMMKLKDRESTSGGGQLSATAHEETRSKKIHDHVEKLKERVQDDAYKVQDDQVRDYNWCAYVLDVLLHAHKNWIEDTHKAFSGPVAYLVPCYADRIVLKTHLVVRTFPTIKGWTTQILNQRQKMELEPCPFGRAVKELIFDPRKSMSSAESDTLCIASSSGLKSKNEMPDKVAKGRVILIDASNMAADAIDNLMKRIEEVSEDTKNDSCSLIAAKSALKLIGVHEMVPEKDQNQVDSMSQAMQDDDLDNPEFLEALDKVMRVAEVRKRWETHGPSFDLGFDFGGKKVVNTTRSDIHYQQYDDLNVGLYTHNEPKNDGTKSISVEAEIQAVLDAYKDIDVNDDFVNDGLNEKSPNLLGTQLVVYGNNLDKTVMARKKKVSNALRSPFAMHGDALGY
ncbi:hypothetical protein AAHA92_17791 [Salvia divinorum]|uniref:Uncharacterized protein n=1 Tax=Salvia divinorum TaxID=28513 RepID=A0ABD1H2T1_SALDI